MSKDLQEIRAFWNSIVHDEEASLQNRVKASELLYKSLSSDPEEEGGEELSLEEKNKRVLALARAIVKGGKAEQI